jgi:hypothetical protein
MSVAVDTIVVYVSVKLLEDVVKKLQNTGENREKTVFMKGFRWFENFGQNRQTEFNGRMKKMTFGPGANLITEGTNQ